MIKNSNLKEKTVVKEMVVNDVTLNSETWHLGTPDGKEQEDKALRKLLGFPISKGLIYYKNPQGPTSKLDVLRYRILEAYDISDFWAKLEIETENNELIKIHSDFLSDMQKPSFLKDMMKERE